MKRFFLFLFISFSVIAQAQSKHFNIDWKLDYQKQAKLKRYNIVLFNDYLYKPDNAYFAQVWREQSHIDGATVKINNLSYSPLSSNWIELMQFHHLPDTFTPKLVTANARSDIYATFRINTIIKKGNQYYKLDAFDISYQYKQNVAKRQAQNIYDSKWSKGSWYKFNVYKSGVYKLDKAFLKSLGVDVNNVNPQHIKIFGNGGKVIPLRNATPYPEDTGEVAIEFVGESDGSFDDGDYILFYAQSHKEWSDEYDSNLNIYTEKTIYFVQVDDQNGKRMQAYQEPVGTVTQTITDYRADKFYEKDASIFTYMGRKAFGEPMGISSDRKTVSFHFDHLLTNKDVIYKIKAASDKSDTRFSVKMNGNFLGQVSTGSIGEYEVGTGSALSGDTRVSSGDIDVELIFDNNGVFDAHLYLEYINLQATCALQGAGKQFPFYNPQLAGGIFKYRMTDAQNVQQIWDITDRFNPTNINNSQNEVEFKFSSTINKRFIAIDDSDYYSPEKPDSPKMSNQNLHKDVFYHTGSFKDVDYLIVTPSFLHNKAEDFADMHRGNGLNVYVADLDLIYNEFGNGQQDIGGIRNFVKYVYNNASTPAKRVRFLLMFGDASVDFKNLIPENRLTNNENTNIVPIFESLNWYSKSYSYASDDFFVMMDNDEGLLGGDEKPDIAVGRLLIRNETDADVCLEKYRHYLSQDSRQNWRTYITLWSDDADNSGTGFVKTTDSIAKKIKQYHPEINIKKIYQDAYVQQVTSGGQRYPQAKRDLFNQFEKGTLILSYLGHGNEVALSHERMVELNDVLQLHNIDRLPLMTTMTCEFAKFDNPTRETAAEKMLWNPQGGVLEMVSTIREIYIGQAQDMDKVFYQSLLGTTAALQGNIIRNPAEALRMTKVMTGRSSLQFNVAFLGDPGYDLAFPYPKVVLTSVNNKPTDTIKALQHINITGQVQDNNGNLMTGYNGNLNAIVFDKYIQTQTLVNDGIGDPVPFEKLGAKIFQGKADVVNGEFSFEFVVPKDINIAYGKGRISFYAENDTEEKMGYDENITVGGVDENAEEDNTPPTIKAYMNDRNFVNGGITDPNPYLLIDLEDEHGINTIGGIGHDISAYLDDDQTKVYILNDFYETVNNSYQKGSVKYRLYDIAPGWHTVHIKAWDVYNNSIATTLDFQVVDDNKIEIDRVLNYPNPFVDYTEFWFTHNHPFEDLDVMIQVYTISGKLVWQHRQSVISDGFLSREISWDGRDNFGEKLAKGVYVYKISVRAPDGKTAHKIEKLVIL